MHQGPDRVFRTDGAERGGDLTRALEVARGRVEPPGDQRFFSARVAAFGQRQRSQAAHLQIRRLFELERERSPLTQARQSQRRVAPHHLVFVAAEGQA